MIKRTQYLRLNICLLELHPIFGKPDLLRNIGHLEKLYDMVLIIYHFTLFHSPLCCVPWWRSIPPWNLENSLQYFLISEKLPEKYKKYSRIFRKKCTQPYTLSYSFSFRPFSVFPPQKPFTKIFLEIESNWLFCLLK